MFEITIEGPINLIPKLNHKMKPFSPTMETLSGQFEENGKKARLILIEGEESLDESLIKIAHIIKDLEKESSSKTRFEFRIRNLAYSEPATGSPQFKEPFSAHTLYHYSTLESSYSKDDGITGNRY